MGGHVLGGVDAHGPEFQNVKMALALAHALLLEQHGTRGIDFNGNAQQNQQPAQADQSQQGQHNGQQPLEKVLIHG